MTRKRWPRWKRRDEEPPGCSFCGRPRDEVQKLIAGPAVYICERCVELCNEILRDEAARD